MSQNENNSKCKSILKRLNLDSSEEAVLVLENLISNNILTLDQVKKVKESLKTSQKGFQNKEKTPTINNESLKKHNKSKYMTRHIALKFHYDGATYSGLAENVNHPNDNSVEKQLFAALQKTCLITSTDRTECQFSRCGRTDKGVSAFGQVIGLRVISSFPIGTQVLKDESNDDLQQITDTDNTQIKALEEVDLPKNSNEKIRCWIPLDSSRRKKQDKINDINLNTKCPPSEDAQDKKLIEKFISEKEYALILNNVLPPNIRVTGWSPVTNEFSARFSTESRTYRYFFVRRDLNMSAMAEAMSYLVGRHDFRNLCKINAQEVDNFERVVLDCNIITTNSTHGHVLSHHDAIDETWSKGITTDQLTATCNNDGLSDQNYRQICYFQIKGQAFLWHQIRCIASILFMVGKGHEKPTIVKELLDIENNPCKPAYPFAPELPLVLHKCDYQNLTFGHSTINLWKTCCDLETKWEELALAAERIRNAIDSLKEDAFVLTEDVMKFIESRMAERQRKVKRHIGNQYPIDTTDKNVIEEEDAFGVEKSYVMRWSDALTLISKYIFMKPSPEGPVVNVPLPLLQRSKGTTVEEKIQSIATSRNNITCSLDSEVENLGKRRKQQRYEEKLSKRKQRCERDDNSFYKIMSTQGGSGI